MSSKLNKLEINITSQMQSINKPKKPNFDDPELSLKEKEKSNDKESESLIFERTKEEDEEIQKLEKIYQDKLKEIEHLTNEIKIKDDEIILMNNAKNKIYNIGSSNPNEENKNINIGKKDISEEELKAELFKLGQKCTKIHEEKIKNMKEEINQLKKQINVYYNKNEYILKEDHDKFLEELKKRHEKELEPFKKELNDLEKYIADNFPEMVRPNS